MATTFHIGAKTIYNAEPFVWVPVVEPMVMEFVEQQLLHVEVVEMFGEVNEDGDA
jgi:hypothetical protein